MVRVGRAAAPHQCGARLAEGRPPSPPWGSTKLSPTQPLGEQRLAPAQAPPARHGIGRAGLPGVASLERPPCFGVPLYRYLRLCLCRVCQPLARHRLGARARLLLLECGGQLQLQGGAAAEPILACGAVVIVQ